MKVKTVELDDYTIFVNFCGKIMKTSFIALHEYAILHHMTDDDVIEKIVEGFDAEVSERTKKNLQSRAELFAKLGNVLLVLKLDKENVIY